ncbi:MAG TPA: short-chain fatty acyl-CoA regulator family protein [Thermoanaerobaculia bacterium]|nr:short-chain fatty acyl-CoA regulator family protein [Thermoanaerobaculia bacterium]
MSSLRLGSKVRALRRREGVSQTELAGKLEISASYLNLIEHNQRPLQAHLLVKLAQVFQVDISAFADDSSSRLAADLQEVFGDPLFEEHPVTLADTRELAENATASRAIVALYRAYRNSVESERALAGRVHDGQITSIDPLHVPSEEVTDVIQQNTNFFSEIETAAETLAQRVRFDRSDMYRSMTGFLRERHGIEVALTPVSADRGAIRRFDPSRLVLSISEVLPPWGRQFQVAHQIGLLEAAPAFDAVLARSTNLLTTPESMKLCRIALSNYFAAALLMPYDDFLQMVENVRYDIELLQHHYTASWEQVCHRLTTLRKPGAAGVSFHFVRVDIAGNISKRFSGTGIRFARFSGSCPRWDVHAAFLTPGRIRTQLSRMPDGTAYFCVARTIRKSYGYASGDALMAVGIGCPVSDARRIVYADAYDLDNLEAAVPIGTTCRLCERLDCDQRAFPPLQQGLVLDENVRGRSFYVPADARAAAATIPVAAKPRKKSTARRLPSSRTDRMPR